MNFWEIIIPLSSKSEVAKKYPKAIYIKDRILLFAIFALGWATATVLHHSGIPYAWIPYVGLLVILLISWDWYEPEK